MGVCSVGRGCVQLYGVLSCVGCSVASARVQLCDNVQLWGCVQLCLCSVVWVCSVVWGCSVVGGVFSSV